MRILVCSSGYNGLKENQIGIFQYDQARALHEHGHDVRIASIDLRSFRRRRHYGSYIYELDKIPIATANFPYGRIPFDIGKAMIAKRCANQAYKLIIKDGWKPDVMHAHFCDVAASFVDIAKEQRIPLITTEHYSKMHTKKVEKHILEAAKYAYRNSNYIIAVSESLRLSIQKLTGFNAMVIPNIVDTDVFFPARDNTDDGTFVFLSASRLVKGKGMDILLKSFANIEDDNCRLVIMGDGPERKNLEALSTELGLEGKVLFKGAYLRKEFQKELQRSNCFVLASRGETFGVVYIEAMAAGIPVIGTSCGGPSEYITSNLGILVPCDDIESLTLAMNRVRENINNYNHIEISNYIKSRYGANEVVCKLEDVYNRVTAN